VNVSNYEWSVPALMSSVYAQDYGYGSVRSTASVASSGSHHRLENIDWNQQQGRRSETVSPEGQKQPEQVSTKLCSGIIQMDTVQPENWVYIILLSELCSFGSIESPASLMY
jgi:hypothetical protein